MALGTMIVTMIAITLRVSPFVPSFGHTQSCQFCSSDEIDHRPATPEGEAFRPAIERNA